MSFGNWNQALLTSLGPLLDLLGDPTVTDIMVNGPDDIWIKESSRSGHHKVASRGWRDIEDLKVACMRISDVIGRPLGPRNLMLDARLPGGERVNIAFPPACERIALTIRKFGAAPMTFADLVKKGTANTRIGTLCKALVMSRQSIIVAGGTGAGKTSLLNALSRFIPTDERVITVEDARELQLSQPNWVALETVEAVGEEMTSLGIGALVKNSLRQNPDRIIVGEVRGDEAFFLLRAFSTGHGGGFGTVHANDGVDALYQLQLLAQMAPMANLTASVTAAMVARAVDVVVFQKIFPRDNCRRISEILEVEKPGVVVSESGIEYRVRPLVQWDDVTREWVFPYPPSQRLQAAAAAAGVGF